jgi:hypothetical protein
MLLAACSAIAAIGNYCPWIDWSSKTILGQVTKPDLKSFFKLRKSYRHGLPAQPFELAQFDFGVDVDLQDEFHWNIKQLFLWVAAEWETPKGGFKHHSVYDRVIRSPEQAVFTEKLLQPKYVLVDLDMELRNTVVNLTAIWDIHPWVGTIQRRRSVLAANIKIPPRYNEVQ